MLNLSIDTLIQSLFIIGTGIWVISKNDTKLGNLEKRFDKLEDKLNLEILDFKKDINQLNTKVISLEEKTSNSNERLKDLNKSFSDLEEKVYSMEMANKQNQLQKDFKITKKEVKLIENNQKIKYIDKNTVEGSDNLDIYKKESESSSQNLLLILAVITMFSSMLLNRSNKK